MWFDERQWRLTASNFGSICKASDRMDKKNKCSLMYSPQNLTAAPIIYGRTHEAIAARKFREVTGCPQIQPTGLFIHPEHNFLAGMIVFTVLLLFYSSFLPLRNHNHACSS